MRNIFYTKNIDKVCQSQKYYFNFTLNLLLIIMNAHPHHEHIFQYLHDILFPNLIKILHVMNITFSELRKIKHNLPTGSVKRIAERVELR